MPSRRFDLRTRLPVWLLSCVSCVTCVFVISAGATGAKPDADSIATQPTPAPPTPAPPTPAPPTVRGPDLRLHRHTLANGLTALLLRDPSVPMVGIFAAIRAGLVHEAPGEDGLSHFLEHLLFNGTETLDQAALYAVVDRLGGYSNATTRADHTLFQMLVPTEQLGRGLELHADMLFRSTLPADKFEKERGIVLEEIAKDDVDPRARFEAEAQQVLWSGTPRARPVIGTPRTIGAIGRDAVVSYWRRRYVPSNVTVLVVGDVEPARFRELVDAAYGDLAPACAPAADPVIALPMANDEGLLQSLAAATDRLEVQVAFRGPDPVTPDAWLLDVLGALLSEGPGATLSEALANRGFSGTEAAAGLERVAGTTTFVVRVTADPTTAPTPLVRAVTDAVAAAAAQLTDTDVAAVQTRLAVSAAFLAEKPHYFGLEKSHLLVNGGAGAVEAEALGVALADRAALIGATDRWLGGRPFRAVAGSPGLRRQTLPLSSGASRTAASGGDGGVTRHTETLSNGLQLSIASNPASSVFAVHVLVRDRAARERADQEGIADLLHRLLTARGERFERELAGIGATVKTNDSPAIPYDDYYNAPEFSYIRFESADAFADAAISLLTEMLGPPQFTAADLAAARQSQASSSTRAEGSAAARSELLLATALYGRGNALTHSVHGTPSTLDPLTAKELREFAPAYLSAAELIVTIETGRDLAATRAAVVARLEGLSAGSRFTRQISPLADAPQSIDETLGKSQAYVRLGAAIRVRPEDRAAAALAAAVLSERLAAEIREGMGMAYSIGAGLTLRPAPWSDELWAAAGTRPENVDTVRDAMVRILTSLRADGPGADEVGLAASRAAGRDMMRRLSGIGRAHATGMEMWRGETPGAASARVEAMATVTPDQLTRALELYFDPAKISVVVVR